MPAEVIEAPVTTAQPAPAVGSGSQPAAATQGTTAAQATQAPAQAATPTVTAEDILSEARLTLSPAEELEQYKTRYSASSTEAKKWKSATDAAAAILEKQGLKLSFDKKGNVTGLEATEAYANAPQVKLSFDDLSKEERELLAENPKQALESAFARISERLQRQMIRATPTIEPGNKVEPLTPERETAVFAWLKDRKTLDGTATHPDAEKHLPLLKQMLGDPTMPAAFVDAYHKAPEFMAELLIGRITLAAQRATARAEKAAKAKQEQTENGQRRADLSPSGQGVAVLSDPSNPGVQSFLDRIGKAAG